VRVLVVNAGSSSLKLSVLDDDRRVRATTVERWDGEGHTDPVREFVQMTEGIEAVGHRVVHGGPRLTESVVVDDDVLSYLRSTAELAPLHNPRSVAGIREVRRLLPGVPAVACFDTSFHTTLSPAAYTYAVPREWNRRWQLRRYGFHGINHSYVVHRAAALIGGRLEELRVVSCHLGAGASLCAVRDGRSVDTTMGFTPLAGLVMATRSGSVDPGLVLWLLQHGRLSPEVLADALEHGAGLKGLSGTSGDLREVLAARDRGDADARLALDVFVHRLRREVGAMVASADGLDLLVFTGGIGEHSPLVRMAVADGLTHLGIGIDAALNTGADGDTEITRPGSGVRTLVVAASEETEIARETRRLVVPA
jgi:acetate kinase